MTDLIGELRSRRLVRELDPIRRPGAGRPTRPIAFDGEPWCVLGVHVNLDKVSFAASTVGGRELWSETVPADLNHSGAEGYAQLDKLLREQLQRIPADQELIAIEIGLGGAIAADRTTVLHYDRFDWRDFDLGGAVPQPCARSASSTPRSASATSVSWPRCSPPGSSYRCPPTPSRSISAVPGRSAAA